MTHPPKPESGPLFDLWDKPTSAAALLPTPAFSAEEAERHRIWCLLTLALTARFWNGNKRGNGGEYPWRASQLRPDGCGYEGGDYLGHNIASVAVNSRGQVLDFDFNHNEIFNSSVEHAEARLIRRLFSLTQRYELPDMVGPPSPSTYSNVLSDVTIYTSLESCSQCSGIMALSSVKQVVYLHRDPGQHSIGNILRNLSPSGSPYRPPLPIPASALGMREFDELDAAYRAFEQGVTSRPFHRSSKNKVDASPSITSFLCTDDARSVFIRGLTGFVSMMCEYPAFKPSEPDGSEVRNALSNLDALKEAREFLDYAVALGRRGTPH